jgi:hypothetical protein
MWVGEGGFPQPPGQAGVVMGWSILEGPDPCVESLVLTGPSSQGCPVAKAESRNCS